VATDLLLPVVIFLQQFFLGISPPAGMKMA
jgi:hypothetical protein